MPSTSSRIISVAAVVMAVVSLAIASRTFAQANSPAAASAGRLALSFEANVGQADKQVQFTARGRGFCLFLTPGEAVLSLSSSSQPRAVVRMKLAGAKKHPQISGMDPLPGLSHYFIGDPTRWRNNVPNYARVKYAAVYPGIDLVYYGNQRQLEYDFVVAPRADPQRIKLTFDGIQSQTVNAHGNLVLAAPGGEIVQQRPIAYQQFEGKRVPVDASYRLLPDRSIGFQIASYDKTRTLVIDPVLVYATYLGGTANDVGRAIALDSAGNAYVTGETTSTDFPGTGTSAIQAVHNGSYDVFVSKMNAAGTALVYSTYLGGSGGDYGYAIAVDATGNAYITGQTDSPTAQGEGLIPFPRVGAFQATYGLGGDAFLTKINSAGNAIVYSTYLGGTGVERGYGVAVDSAGQAYFTGSTNSVNFPTVGPMQVNGGSYDAFVVKLNAAGSAMIYSTYLGGNGSESSVEGGGIAVDSSGNAYVAGTTTSTNFPGVTITSFQASFGGGFNDGFVAKLNPSGNALVFSTYLGGDGYDSVYGIAIDGDLKVYVTGYTDSTDFPTGIDFPFQESRNGTGNDAFVTALTSAGSGMVYSTYLGGAGNDLGYDISVSASGRAFISGTTGSTDFPTTSPIQAFNSGAYDMFVSELNAVGSTLLFSTYFGGSTGFEEGRGIAVDTTGNVFVTGSVNSTNLPVLAPFQPSYGGSGSDALIVKIAVGLEPAAPTGVTATAQSATNVLVAWDAVPGATSYEVLRQCNGEFFPFMSPTSNTSLNDEAVSPGSTYLYWVRAVNATGTSPDSSRDLATTVIFSDDPLVANTTAVKSVHLQQLRSAVNAVRVCAGLLGIGYVGSDGSPGTVVWSTQFEGLRTNLDEAMGPLGLPNGGYSGGLTAGATIQRTHVTEIRTTVK